MIPKTRLAILVLIATTTVARADVKITPDVVYGHKHGMALTMDVFQPENSQGLGVLFMVSGGWHSRWTPPPQVQPFFQSLLDAGFTVFAVRHGSSPKYVIPEIVEDVRRSVRFVRANAEQYGIDPDRLGVCGGSAGGHLSLLLGTTGDDGDPAANDEVLRAGSRVAAVVAYFPPTDLRPFVQPGSPYLQNFPALVFDPTKVAAMSPLLNVSQDDAPALMIHGDKDELVPLLHSEQIAAAFSQHEVANRLLTIEGAGHGFGGEDAKRANEAMVAWFQERLVGQRHFRSAETR